MKLADSLRQFRKAHGLKALEVAEILEMTPEHISRCENGQRSLSKSAWKVLKHHVGQSTETST